MVEVQVRKQSRASDRGWSFTSKVPDVTNLRPNEEESVMWEALCDGELVGIIVVDTIPSVPVIQRIAVRPSYRRSGIATALVESVLDDYDTVECNIEKSNTASQSLFSSVGFSEGEVGKYGDLITYRYD